MDFVAKQKNDLINDLNKTTFNELTNKINNEIKQKYNYTNDQLIAYFQGIEDATIAKRAYHNKQNLILHETINQLVNATNLLNFALKELIPKNCDYCNQNPNDTDCHPYLCRDWENTITHWKHYDEVVQLLKECDCLDSNDK